MCYGISQAYKESANCRLEAQYAYQQQKEMIPLMLEEGYHANGWLGMLLGVRMWYAFCGSVLGSEALFEGKVDELCRELGERGRVMAVSTMQSGALPSSQSDAEVRAALCPSLAHTQAAHLAQALDQALHL